MTEIVLATNTAQLIKRDNSGSYTLIASAPTSIFGGASSGRPMYSYGLLATGSLDLWTWISVFNPSYHASNPSLQENQTFARSNDFGSTWTLDTWSSGAAGYEPTLLAFNNKFTTNALMSRDETGRIFAVGDASTGHTAGGGIIRLDAYTTSSPAITRIVNSFAIGTGQFIRPMWAGGGYVWFGYTDTQTDLYRCAYDGTGVTSFALSSDIPITGAQDQDFISKIGTNTLWVINPWFVSSSGLGGVTQRVMSIDITNPNAPVVLNDVAVPFSATEYIVSLCPVSDLVAYAHVIDYSTATIGFGGISPDPIGDGSVYKTTDGGATWVQVLAPTPNLGIPLLSSFLSQRLFNTIAANENNVWCASAYPLIAFSTDAGVTWSFEDASSLALASAPSNTGSISWQGILIGVSLYPGIAKVPQGTGVQSWFTRTSP